MINNIFNLDETILEFLFSLSSLRKKKGIVSVQMLKERMKIFVIPSIIFL